MRIIITGSRHWIDRDEIDYLLYWACQEDEELVIVHGGCPTGADAIADEIARGMDIPVEVHPADWSLGRRAGPLRNQRMVDLGADACHAFPLADSRGTWDCVRRAEAAGIPVVIHRAVDIGRV